MRGNGKYFQKITVKNYLRDGVGPAMVRTDGQ